jgi:phage-related protein
VLSEIWEKVKTTVAKGVGWVADTWVVRELSTTVREAVAPVADLISEPLGRAISLVTDAVDAILHLILTPIRRAWARLAPHLDGVLAGLVDFFTETRDGFLKLVRVHLPNLLRWTAARIREARDHLAGLIAAVRRWATEQLARIWAELANAIAWVKREVLAPLWARVTGVWDWTTARVSELFDRVRGIVAWVRTEVWAPLWRRVNQVVDYVVGPVAFVVRVVTGLAGFFAALLHHGPGALLELVVPGLRARSFTRTARQVSANAYEVVATADELADHYLRL